MGMGIAQYPYLLPRSLAVQVGSAPAASLWSVMVGPGFLLLFTLRHRQKLSGTGMAIQPSASRPPGARALARRPSPS